MKLLKSSVILGRIRQSFLLFISLSLLPLGQLQSQNFEGGSIAITDSALAGETVVKILEFKGSLYFATKNADGRQVKLWRVNSDLGGIVEAFDITIKGGTNLDFFHEHWLFRQNDKYIFFLHAAGSSLELWRFDGVSAQQVTSLGGDAFIESLSGIEGSFPLLHGFGYSDNFCFQESGGVYRLRGDGNAQQILHLVYGPLGNNKYGPKVWFTRGALVRLGEDLALAGSAGTAGGSDLGGTRGIRLGDGETFRFNDFPSFTGAPFDAQGGQDKPLVQTYSAWIWRDGNHVIYSVARLRDDLNGIWRFEIPTGGSTGAGTLITLPVEENLDASGGYAHIRNVRFVPQMRLVFFNTASSIEYPDATSSSKTRGTDELFAADLETSSIFLVSDYHDSRRNGHDDRAVDLYDAVHHDGNAYLILEKGNVRTNYDAIPFDLYRTDGSKPDPPITRGDMGDLKKVHNERLFSERDVAYIARKRNTGGDTRDGQQIMLDPDDPYMISFKGHLYYRVKGGNLYRISSDDTMGAEVAGAGTKIRYLKIIDNTLYWLAVPPLATDSNLQLLSTDGNTVSVLTDIAGGLRALPITPFNGLVFAGGLGSSASLVGGIAPKPALEQDVTVSAGGMLASFRYTPGVAVKRYWVVLGDAATAPSVQQVVAGRDGDGTDAAIQSTENSLSLPKGIAKGEAILGLTPSTTYRLYLVLENVAGGDTVLVTKGFTTTGGDTPDPSIDFSGPALLGRGLHIITLPMVALIDFTPDEPLSYYWVLQQKDQLEPGITQVTSGQNGEGTAAIQASSGPLYAPYLTPQTVRIEGLTPDTEYGFYLWAQDHNSPANGMEKIVGKVFQTQDEDAKVDEPSRLVDIPNIRVDNITTTSARIYFTPLEDIDIFFVVIPNSATHPPTREQIMAAQNQGGTNVPSGQADDDDFAEDDQEDYLEVTGLEGENEYTAYVLIKESDGFLETRVLRFSTPASDATLASLEGPIAVSVDSSGNATVTFTPTEAGSYLYVVGRASESPPSTSQVKQGQSGSGAPALRSNSEDNTAMRTLVADTQKEFVLSGLPLEASYRVHLVFEDSGQAVSNGVFSSEAFRMYFRSPVLHADIEPTVDFGKHATRRRKQSPVILLRVGGRNATSNIEFTKTDDDDRFEVEVVDGSSIVTGGVSGMVLAITMSHVSSSADPSPVTASLNLTYSTQTLVITLTGQTVSDTKTVSGVPSSLDFGPTPAGENASRSLRVFGNNLDTDDVSISFGSSPSPFSAESPIAGEGTNAVLGTEVIVTFSPTSAVQEGEEITETLTLSYMDGTDDDATVMLSAGIASDADGTSGTGPPVPPVDPVDDDPPVTNPTFGSTIDNQTYTANMAITPLILPEASGGTVPLSYTLTPALPNGLSFDANTRKLSGTPTTASTIATMLTYTVTDSTALTVSLTFTITVNAEGSPTFADTVANQNYAKDTAIMNLMLPSATGGSPPLMYSLTPALPAGLEFDVDSRTLSGTPTVDAATTSYTYTVTDGTGGTALTASLTFTITVNEALSFITTVDAKTYTTSMAITPLVLPEASGGTVPLSYTLTPALPNGLSFDAGTRRLTGTPGEAASATPYTYTVTDNTTGTAVTASLTFTITVREALSFITTIDNQAYTANVAITPLALPTASGGMGSLTYTLTPALPNGLSFDADNIPMLTGTPTTASTTTATPYTYTVTDNTALTASLTFTITVNVEGSPTFADTVANQNYAKDTAVMNLMLPSATGGTPSLMYSLTPALPAGLEFDVDSRTLSGTPTVAAATASYTYTVTDSTADTALTASLTFTITVSEALRFITTIDAKTYTKDTAITPLILPEALGGTVPLSYTLTPALPNGLSFDANTRRLTGTPMEAASATSYTYMVTDGTIGTAVTASLTFMITVSEALGFITTIGNQAYTVNMAITPLTLPEASGGVGRLTYTLTPALPNGLSFDANTRRLTGTPMEATFARPYTYTATDRATGRALMTFTITVSDAEIFGIGNPGATVHVYPNPAGDVLHIEFPGADEYGIALLTLTGKPVLGERHAGGGTRVLDLSSLTRGVYFLKIEDGVGISHTLLIIR